MTETTFRRLLTGFIVAVAIAAVSAQNPVTVFQWGANVLRGHGVASGALRVELPSDGTGLVNAAQSGTWTVTGAGGTFPVTGTFWQGTQPVSGPLTDTQLRATPVPVSGTFWQTTQPVSGTFWQTTQPVSGPVTDTQLRATPVPVSGTFWQSTQPVSGTFFQATQPVSLASGTVASGAFASGAVASGAYGSDSGSFGVGATGAAPPAKASFAGALASGATGGFLTGITVCDLHKPVSITSATTTLLISGVSGRHIRICSLNLVTAIANNVALISGTGATCGTGTAGISGGTTAANGWNFAANGGLTIGSGLGEVMRTVATGDSACAITSAAGPLAGNLSYTIY